MNIKIKPVYYIMLALVLTGLVACKKPLDTVPDTSLTDLKTFDDVRSALRGAYDGFQSNNYYGSPAASGSASAWSALPELMGDDFVEALESLGNWNIMSEMSYASDNGAVAAAFIQPYEIISRVNNLLKFVEIYETGATEAETKRIKAQALAIRAHAHFDLMRYFAVDFSRNSTALGVPFVTIFDPQKPFANLPARNTVKENYDAILKDLGDALVAFRDGGNTTGNTSRNYIDSAVVYAMRARVNYYASDWNAVIADANIALALRPVGNSAAYIAAFSTAGETAPSSEVYWVVPSDNALRPGGAISGTSPNYRVTVAMSNILQTQGGAYVDPGVNRFNQAGSGGIQRTLSWKYPGVRSFKVFRAGELLLMRAEAKQRTNDLTALADLNLLRTNRGVAIGAEVGPALLDAILLLRRVELLGEGHRWFDLRRTTKTIARAECGVANGSRADNCNIGPTSRSWTFPIPFNEIKVNANLVQNQGY
ncbi:RagB/SusD family nutrient uptake outer membrane protein [Lacibacter sp. H407]|uniref:RagB/SusD family nutrient uptake outer membrane protein n=1 Tax=Lacibacter sp. H407 TaxID=3133423 RepID=UPI0030BCEEA9